MFRILLALFFAASSLAAQDSPRWTLYQSLDWPARLDYLNKQPNLKGDGAFLLQALDQADSSRVESSSDQDTRVKKEITLTLIKMLSEGSVQGAAAAIGRLPAQYKDPVLKGESWLALAKLGDQSVVPGLVTILGSLNDSGTRSRNEEIEAAYAVQALGLLKAADAFRTVAAASLAWYSPASQVRASALKTLPLLVPDFEKALLPLLADDPDLTFREGLFQEVVDRGDAALTSRAASAVLGSLVSLRPESRADQDRVRRLTLFALSSAQAAASPSPAVVPALKVLLGRPEAYEVQAQSVRLLGKMDDPDAVSLLTDTLSKFNARQKAGVNTSQDLALVKELFQALAQTGKAAARTALDEARFSDYTPGFVREAQAAEDRLPRE